MPPTAPSFRPAAPQFSLLQTPQNPAFQNPNAQNLSVQPPGVSPVPVMVPGGVSGAGSATVTPMMHYQVQPGQHPNQAMRPYPMMPNGYPTMPMPGSIPPPGVLHYPSPYGALVRPAFSPRPLGTMGVLPALPRPPYPGFPGIRPMIPLVRPAVVPIVTPAEKPQTTIYVGNIAPTVENDFMLSLLQLCGPVKSWKRPQDPTDGTPKGFGFCEFESAEGVLRALRLLSKFNVDGQELALNVNQAKREYLERYVEKKIENSKKLKELEAEGAEKEEDKAPGLNENESPKPSEEDSKKDDIESGNKESQDTGHFGIVTDEDKEADRDALEKLTGMLEERIKTRPLPPPPPLPSSDITGNSRSEQPSKDGDSDVDIMRNDAIEDKNDDDTTSENKAINDHDRPETGSPNRSRKYDRNRERDRERDLKREKEREFDKLEREAQRERERKERERDRKVQEAERAEREYKERVKEWESREREKERQRLHEKEREKERERKRKKEIKDDESDDDDSRKRLRRSVLEDKRRKRLREKEDDLDDRLKEEKEKAEAERRAKEELQQQELQLQQQQQEQELQEQQDALKVLSGHGTDGSEKSEVAEEMDVDGKDNGVEQAYEGESAHTNHSGDVMFQNGTGDDESTMASTVLSDPRQSSNAPSRKLGFGLVGSGKRTAVPSVFTVEEDDAQNDTKMRPLIPIDYSTEELQAIQVEPSNADATPPNLAAAAEFAKRISNVNHREEKPDSERERSRRYHDRSSHRDRDRSGEDSYRHRDENREKNCDRDRDREHGSDKLKTPDNKKLLDAKQLIDMIPKTKEELFSFEIDWAVYDKHELHERMRPWISKKITEFLGEEEPTLVDYIVSSTQEHVKATQMLELLQSILDDEAEMFVLKMWRMLIFEIKKVETGLAIRTKT